ncbi:MAG TPA: alpha/beta hydrolase [Thermomicrobiales bacterium]|jgi:pimeloyl-ACP methyl ester carboxylesterase|nr:alpha/beta hydrolase [Thermomicrobiales bacterium]
MSRPAGLARPSWVLTVLLALLIATGTTGLAVARDATPAGTPGSAGATPVVDPATIDPVPCTTRYQVPEGFVDGENITCGYLTVPAFPGDAGSPVVRLHVMRLVATGDSPRPEPLVVLTGGPGQNGGSLLPLFLPATEQVPISYAPLLENQDVILFDQRGTGASESVLTCPGDAVPLVVPPGDPATSGTPVAATPAAKPVGTPAGEVPVIALPDEDVAIATVVQCLQAIEGTGVDLAAFNTENNAADVAALIGALDAGQADLYGISYGSYLGQRVITRYPELVRSAVLASVVAPDTDIFVRQVTGLDESLTRIFALCEADAQCAAANADLDASLQAAYDRLEAEPAIVELTDPASQMTAGIPIDGELFLQTVYLLAFTSQPYGVPPVISQVAAGDFALLEVLAPLITQAGGLATGLLGAVYCQDFAQDVDLDQVLADAGVRPVLEQGFTTSWRSFNAVCEAIDLPTAAAEADTVGSNVPTLLISGGLDTITPAEDADVVLFELPAGQEVTFDVLGHDPGTAGGTCSIGLIGSFLAAPEQPVDAGCAEQVTLDMSPPGFYDEGEATPVATPVA